MFDKLIDIVRKDEKNWTKFQQAFIEKEIASKTVLLHEGAYALENRKRKSQSTHLS